MIPTKPNNVTWTDDQWKAIYAKGHDILVAAAAGSGKTAVLIERLIQKILAPKDERIDVDALLVVTFTNAAAAEMRSRMAAALEKAVESATDPEQTQFLRRQLSLIGKAQISTLHSFCLTVCRQYAYMIDLDPGFRIASQDEVALLKDDVLAQVLEQAYKGEAPHLPLEAVYTLVDSFTSDRNDTQIESLVERLYEMARVQPKPYEWLDRLPNEYDIAPDVTVDELSFIDDLKLAIEHQLLEAKYHYAEMIKLATVDNGLQAYDPFAREEAAYIEAALNRICEGTWQETADIVKEISFKTIPRVKKDTFDEVAKEKATGHRDAAKKILATLKTTYFNRDATHLVDEIRKMQPIIESLVKLTKLFSEAFKAAKLERSIIDFSDLEHYALEILTEPDVKEITPSAVALDYRERFAEVLVDEYQDVNLLQETILQLVKKGDTANGNMFMVGDVKQSIYQFRLAEPRLFLQKYKEFTPDANGTGMKIDLNRNFRSRQEVLHSTNYVFEQVMDEGVGEINYDDQASLKYGEGYNEDHRALETELVIFDEKGKESFEDETDGESLEKSQREARYIMKRIKEMVGQEQVYDAKTKSYRDMRYSDIVILMRSMRWASDLAEEFKREKIPLYADSSKGYFEAIEVMIMMNLLKIIDNPYQDIPLASVLRAPFVGLTENELAEIRLANPRASFYEAMQSYLQDANPQQEETRQKVQQFQQQLMGWRDFSRRGSLADLIWTIYLETNYFEMVGAMANGKQRQANLRALHDRAIAYEKSSFRGLFRFLRFIDRMRSRGDDLGIAKSIGEGEDVVRLVTIHSSKGLEYPVVFVAGINGKFNMMDFRGSYMFDQDFGIAVKAIDPELRVVSTSLPYLALKEKKIAKMKAEEMRILYVAMTRAKEKLILVGAVSDWQKKKEKWSQYQSLDSARLPDYVRANAMSYLDWIGPAVARHRDFLTLTYQDAKPEAAVQMQSTWLVKVLDDSIFAMNSSEEKAEEDIKRADVKEGFVTEIDRRFTASYPYEEAVRAKSKTSVSEVKRLQALQYAENESAMDAQLLKKSVRASSVMARPQFLQQRSMTGAEIGTVVHAVMQHVPQQGFMSTDAVDVFLQQLVAKKILRAHEVEVIEAEHILRFFESPIGQRFMKAKTLLREVPFTLRHTNELGIPQIMQGVIDCIMEDENGKWVLLDYKTDKIRPPFSEGEALQAEMEQRYAIQLGLYAEALEKIKHIQVDEKVLYLYDIGEVLHLK